MKKRFSVMVLWPALLMGVLNVWFFFQLPSMMFFPDKKLISTPADWGLEFADAFIETKDHLRIHGWFIPAPYADEVVLFFHGNAGNISHREHSIKIFHQLGLNVLIIDYRGYGLSEGDMSEQGAYLDAEAAWQYLVDGKGFRPQEIIIFGRSLGGAVAVDLANRVNQKALILESTFSSVRDMASRVMPVINKIFWLRYSFNTRQKIALIESPLLLMHSQNDEMIPYEQAEIIFRSALSPRYFNELSGGHNSGFLQNIDQYKQAIRWFIDNAE